MQLAPMLPRMTMARQRRMATAPFNSPAGAVTVAQQAVSSSPQLFPAAATITVCHNPFPTVPLAATSTVTTSTSQPRNIVSVQNNVAAIAQSKSAVNFKTQSIESSN